jgi:hypothetical protein
MNDVFTGYQNFFIKTLDVVVHEWAPNLNIGMENLCFCITNIFIMMHPRYPQKLFYVPMICALFQQTMNDV